MNFGGEGSGFGAMGVSGGESFSSPGGFMPDTSFNSSLMESKRGKGESKLAMVPVTVAGILNSNFDDESDMYEMEGVRYRQVTFVGLVTKITENMTHLAYEIDDMTAYAVTVRRWINKQETPGEYQRLLFREDTYVRVFGYIKVDQDGKRSVVAYDLSRVTDFNEITYHKLAVIYAHLSLKKRAEAEKANPAAPASNLEFEGSGMSTAQFQILEIICTSTTNKGMNINEIKRRMQGTSEASIRDAIDFLCNEGHVYTTVDDDHFRSTSM